MADTGEHSVDDYFGGGDYGIGHRAGHFGQYRSEGWTGYDHDRASDKDHIAQGCHCVSCGGDERAVLPREVDSLHAILLIKLVEDMSMGRGWAK